MGAVQKKTQFHPQLVKKILELTILDESSRPSGEAKDKPSDPYTSDIQKRLIQRNKFSKHSNNEGKLQRNSNRDLVTKGTSLSQYEGLSGKHLSERTLVNPLSQKKAPLTNGEKELTRRWKTPPSRYDVPNKVFKKRNLASDNLALTDDIRTKRHALQTSPPSFHYLTEINSRVWKKNQRKAGLGQGIVKKSPPSRYQDSEEASRVNQAFRDMARSLPSRYDNQVRVDIKQRSLAIGTASAFDEETEDMKKQRLVGDMHELKLKINTPSSRYDSKGHMKGYVMRNKLKVSQDSDIAKRAPPSIYGDTEVSQGSIIAKRVPPRYGETAVSQDSTITKRVPPSRYGNTDEGQDSTIAKRVPPSRYGNTDEGQDSTIAKRVPPSRYGNTEISQDSLIAKRVPPSRYGNTDEGQDSMMAKRVPPSRYGNTDVSQDSLISKRVPPSRYGNTDVSQDSMIAKRVPPSRYGKPDVNQDSLIAKRIPPSRYGRTDIRQDSLIAKRVLPSRYGITEVSQDSLIAKTVPPSRYGNTEVSQDSLNAKKVHPSRYGAIRSNQATRISKKTPPSIYEGNREEKKIEEKVEDNIISTNIESVVQHMVGSDWFEKRTPPSRYDEITLEKLKQALIQNVIDRFEHKTSNKRYYYDLRERRK